MRYLDTEARGKFVVIYGANNIGKSTQTGMLVSKITTEYHEQVLLIKYPVYGLNPTGPELKKIIKGHSGNSPIPSALELQKLYAQNRKDFQDIVEVSLKSGVHVIAEDYVGTGLAWGITNGVSLKALLEINNYLLVPDISILLDGRRFKSSIERSHIFENAGNEVWDRNREIHLKLAKKYGWKIIKSDESVDKVHEAVWLLVKHVLGLK